MGNALLRELSCLGKEQKKNRKGNRGVKRRRQEMAAAEGETQGQEESGKEFLSTSNQDPGNGGSEEVCYTVIRHAPPRRPSLSASDHGYENVDCAPRRAPPRGASETEYAQLSAPAASPAACSAEHDYELVLLR
uniref:Germinal center associated signaling and motility like n=1 Tax=Sciurus vulgaris TaxID=55149 RepID=A0A8D2AU39_SCIVU